MGAALMAAAGAARSDCWDAAARYYHVNPLVLRAIAQHESRNDPLAQRLNRNGSEDIGPMQINSRWLPLLRPYGIGRQELFDPCTNVMIGAWILSQQISRYGNTYYAIGTYHSSNPARALSYARAIQQLIIDWGVYDVEAAASRTEAASGALILR